MTPSTLTIEISIHALHEESDRYETGNSNGPQISIHALHEESDISINRMTATIAQFQSTLSMRRATANSGTSNCQPCISIHALHEESDRFHRDRRPKTSISIHALHEESDYRGLVVGACNKFQSTLSMRRATVNVPYRIIPIPISIHALHEESDLILRDGKINQVDFNPRSP